MYRSINRFLWLSCIPIFLLCFLIVVYVKWYDDLYHIYVMTTTPRSFILLTEIEADKAVEAKRISFQFFGGVKPDEVFIKIYNSYYVPLYHDKPMYSRFYPDGSWWYVVLVDQLPVTGAVFIRRDDGKLLSFPFVVTPDKYVVHLTQKPGGEYELEVRQQIWVI